MTKTFISKFLDKHTGLRYLSYTFYRISIHKAVNKILNYCDLLCWSQNGISPTHVRLSMQIKTASPRCSKCFVQLNCILITCPNAYHSSSGSMALAFCTFGRGHPVKLNQLTCSLPYIYWDVFLLRFLLLFLFRYLSFFLFYRRLHLDFFQVRFFRLPHRLRLIVHFRIIFLPRVLRFSLFLLLFFIFLFIFHLLRLLNSILAIVVILTISHLF